MANVVHDVDDMPAKRACALKICPGCGTKQPVGRWICQNDSCKYEFRARKPKKKRGRLNLDDINFKDAPAIEVPVKKMDLNPTQLESDILKSAMPAGYHYIGKLHSEQFSSDVYIAMKDISTVIAAATINELMMKVWHG